MGTAPVTQNCIIANNTAVNSAVYSVFTGGDAVAAHDVTIINNLFVQNKGIMFRDYNVGYPLYHLLTILLGQTTYSMQLGVQCRD